MPNADGIEEYPLDPADAWNVACHRRAHSNLARCYLDVRQRLTEVEAQRDRYKALHECLPPGYAIGDDATAELAVELMECKAQLSEARNKAIEEIASIEDEAAKILMANAREMQINGCIEARNEMEARAFAHEQRAKAIRALSHLVPSAPARDDAWALRLIATSYDEGQALVISGECWDDVIEYEPCNPKKILTHFLDSEALSRQGEIE